ncbi:MAG: hypothetical protein ACLPPV_08375 [Candidatus Korobacteraceae bacterium]|jgi:hypothetical protein
MTKHRGWPDRRGLGAQSDFISEQFVPSERHIAQQRAMAETLTAAGLNAAEFGSLSTPEETVSMAERRLRIVREEPKLGICKYCNMQFPIDKGNVALQFDEHKCKREDTAKGRSEASSL